MFLPYVKAWQPEESNSHFCRWETKVPLTVLQGLFPQPGSFQIPDLLPEAPALLRPGTLGRLVMSHEVTWDND